MIQRIQSLYLLIAAVLSSGLIFAVQLWTQQSGALVKAMDLFAAKELSLQLIPVLFFGTAVLSVVTIFLFKNRQLQFVLSRLNMLINLFLLGLLIYVSQTLSGEASVSEKGIGMFIPVIVVLLLVIANRAIKKDEDLVKSVDRLR